MPNGYRVGGTYTRNGRQFTRRGTRIARPSVKLAAVGIAVGAAALFGTGSMLTVTVAAVGITALVCYRYRRPIRRALRPLRPVGRKAVRWADKRMGKREVFNPANGVTIKTVRGERAARRATAGNGRDYARQGEGW